MAGDRVTFRRRGSMSTNARGQRWRWRSTASDQPSRQRSHCALTDSRDVVGVADAVARGDAVQVSRRSLRHAAGRRLIPILVARQLPGERAVVFRTVVGALEALPPHGRSVLAGRGARSRACATGSAGPRRSDESLPNGRTEPLAAVEDHQHVPRDVEVPLKQRPARTVR